jgi:hypothetical protein
MHRKSFLKLVSLIFACLACSQFVFGQATTTATLLGTVKDQGGAVIAGARVTAKNLETGLIRTATTDTEGRYRIAELAPGIYEVQAEREGFSVQVRSSTTLTVGREMVTDFSLTVGSLSERIAITGQASLVETTNATLSGLVNNRTIQELPLNGRDVFQLTSLQTGVVSTTAIVGGVLGESPTTAGPGGSKISVNGARISANSFLLDGTSVNDAFNNTPGGLSGSFLGVDALQEFQVVTNSYGAEYGQAGGAVINAVTKSGTNSLHGSAYEFHRNSVFDARNFFDPGGKPPFKRNQFGGTLGGRIIKDRTFLFGNYEGLRQDLGASKIFTIPTAAARARAVPAAQPYVNLYPAPNGRQLNADTAQYIRPAQDITSQDAFMVRVDHHFSESNNFFARYSFDDSELKTATGPIEDTLTFGRNQYVTLSDTHIFSQRFVNVARIGYNRSFILGDQFFTTNVPASLSYIPGRQLGGFFNLANDFDPPAARLQVPRQFAYNVIEFSDQATYNRGGHSLKFGGLVRRIQFNSLQGRAADGVYVIAGLNALLNASPTVFVAPTPGSSFYRGIRTTVIGTYIQDDWKARPNLTLNFGLRYEFFTTPTEVNGLVANLRKPTDAAPTVGDPFIDNPSYKNFAPRFGFAWQPFKHQKTSVRGAFGLFDVLLLPFNYRSEMTLQPPFSVTAQVLFPPFPNGFNSIANNFARPEFNAFFFAASRSYLMQYNLSVQQELGFDTVLSVAYVGSRGVHLVRRTDVNSRKDFVIQPDGSKFFPAVSGGVAQANKVNPAFGQIRMVFTDGNSHYHGLQTNLTKRLSRNLEFTTSYTFAKAIDDSSDYNSQTVNNAPGTQAQDTFNTRGERARSSLDVRHTFNASWVYVLPLGDSLQGAARKFVHGWQLNGFVNARTGFFFTPLLAFDNARDGVASSIGQRPNLAPGRTLQGIVLGRPNLYFDPTAFVLPPAGTYGSVGRNVLEGPGAFTVDFGVTKNTNITEGLRVQFRAEFFNLFNRANFAIPDSTTVRAQGGAIPGNAGVITRTVTTSRQLQFGLKFIF